MKKSTAILWAALANDRFAVRRTIPWRSYCLSAGCILCIGGGIVFVSTPAAGGLVVGFGLLLMIGGSHE